LQFVSPWQAVVTVVPHAPLRALLMQLAQASVVEFSSPGVMQYSVAHLVAQPPLALQTQLAMSWKNVLLPPMQPVWQQSTQLCELFPSHVVMLLWVRVQVPPLPLPDELPLLDPEELPLLEPLLDPEELPLLEPLLDPEELPLLEPLLEPDELPLLEPLLDPLELPLLDPLELPLLEPLLDPLELPASPLVVTPESSAPPPGM
jgi:hypothetical protein